MNFYPKILYLKKKKGDNIDIEGKVREKHLLMTEWALTRFCNLLCTGDLLKNEKHLEILLPLKVIIGASAGGSIILSPVTETLYSAIRWN